MWTGGLTMFWNLTTLAALSVANYFAPASLGVSLSVYSSDPMIRMEQMMIDSENLRQMHDEWRRGAFINTPPGHATPYRIHGGVGPCSPDI
jgi:hypothetical protein